MIIEWISYALISIGAFLSLIGGLGLLRLPDFYSRLHANGITDTLCTFMVLLGLALQFGLSLATVKLGLIFLFLFFTSPTSSYSLSNSAWQWGLRPNLTGKKIKEQQHD